MRKAIEKQTIVTERPEDLDVIGIAGDELEAAVQVFYVRRGRVVGRKGFVVDKVEDVTPGGLVGHVLEGVRRADAADVPHQVLVPDLPDDLDVYREFLCEVRGSNVSMRVPQRGDKRALQETVTQNAKEEFVRHRLKRASDHNARARALNALQDALDLPDAPLRIECFDMSHIQGRTTWARWWSWRTACPRRATTAGSIKESPATTTSRPWRRCSPAASPP